MSLPPLRLQLEQGKDWGLSIIGTRHELLNLARSLEAAASEAKFVPFGNLPQQILGPEVESPYIDQPGFFLSFCIEERGPSETAMQKARSGPSPIVFILITVLSLIGLTTSIGWIWRAVL